MSNTKMLSKYGTLQGWRTFLVAMASVYLFKLSAILLNLYICFTF